MTRPVGTITEQPFQGGGRLLLVALIVGAVGAVLTIVGFAVDATQTFFSYLIAYNYVLTIVLGMMVFLLTCHAMNATWPTALRRLAEATTATMPLLAILYIPIFFGLNRLYPWTHPALVSDPHTRELLEHKLVYLNVPFFSGRAVFYLLLWVGICIVLRGLSLRLDAPGRPEARGMLKVFSAAILPLAGLSITFAAFDWVMALSPDWYSTMFGVYYFAGGFLASIAVVVVLLAAAQRQGFFLPIGRSHYYALGRLLLAFVVFWTYIAFFQFFLMWIGNKPLEAHWYLDRIKNGYAGVSWFLLIGHFVVPFFVLLSYWIKQTRERLTPVAWWLIFAHYFDVHWLIAPASHRAHVFVWEDLVTVAGVAGLAVAFGVWRQRGRLLAPVADPAYELALAYESK